MGQALYRKYRPLALGEVIGQEHITETLARAIKAGHISHAYLFTGPHGVGKTSVARILAHDINQLPYSDEPHLDIIEIDAASNRRIDDIRDLRDKVHIAPIGAKYKVYIIDEVHMLTGESFNALLKTLEEPPSHVVFILATTESHKLPATIISRTQRFTFRPATKQKGMLRLRTVADKEGITITDDALALIAEHGNGSFRDSLSLLDQLSHVSGGEITVQNVTQSLGLAAKAKIDALVQAITSGDRLSAAEQLSQLEASGASTSSLVGQLSQALLAAAPQKPNLYRLIDSLLEAPRAYNPSLKMLSAIMVHLLEQPTVQVTTPPSPSKPATPKKQETAPPKKATPPKDKAKAEMQTISSEPLTNLSPQDWGKVLDAAKKSNPALFAVIKQAQPLIDDGGQLVLKFKFTLHSKKIDDAKSKAKLAALMQHVLGVAPVITTQVDKMATPLTAAADPDIADVAAIMGGGEVIPNAETI